ncbi:hypothetical protein R1sor_022826 [Riccia sorocarpa]|uniref:Reverse transcriptase zinc-binding domain-containing protein n=1 Tax=Riccia sorocarpa TaxID=122646 RepID=A0ABD3GPA8_9MARC
MHQMAQAFLLKNVSKILQGSNEDWVRLAVAIIKARIMETAHLNEDKQWDHNAILLGLKALRVPSSNILDRMLKCWFKMKRRLTLQPDRGPYPENATPRLVLNILQSTDTADLHEINELQTLLRKLNLKQFSELSKAPGQVYTLHELATAKGISISDSLDIAMNKMQTLFSANETAPITWAEAMGWKWAEGPTTTGPPWKLTSAQWRHLLYNCKDENAKINDKWEAQDNNQTWKSRWSQLWSGAATSRAKTRFWRFLRTGYLSNAKAKTWNRGTGLCNRCQIEHETLTHAIWDCPRLLERKRWISWLFLQPHQRTTSLVTGEPIMTVIGKALLENQANQALMLILLATWRSSWSERNDQQFNQRTRYKPINHIIAEVEEELKALKNSRRKTDTQEDHINTAMDTVEHWKMESTRWLEGHTDKRTMATPETHTSMRTDQNSIAAAMFTPNTETGTGQYQQASTKTRIWEEEDMIRWENQHQRQEGRQTRNTKTIARRKHLKSRMARTRKSRIMSFQSQERHVAVNSVRSTTDGANGSQDHVNFDTVEDLIQFLLGFNVVTAEQAGAGSRGDRQYKLMIWRLRRRAGISWAECCSVHAPLKLSSAIWSEESTSPGAERPQAPRGSNSTLKVDLQLSCHCGPI